MGRDGGERLLEWKAKQKGRKEKYERNIFHFLDHILFQELLLY